MSLPFTQCSGTCHSALFRTKMPLRVSCIRRNENCSVIGLSAAGHLPNVTNKTVLRAVGSDKQNHRALLFIVLFQAHLKASLERNRDESQSHCSQKELSWVNGPYLVPRESYTDSSKSQPFIRLYVLPKPGLICLQRSDLLSLPMHHQNRILNEPKLQAGNSFKNVRSLSQAFAV